MTLCMRKTLCITGKIVSVLLISHTIELVMKGGQMSWRALLSDLRQPASTQLCLSELIVLYETSLSIKSVVAQKVKVSAYNERDLGSIPGSGRPWRRKWPPTPVILPGISSGRRSLQSTGSEIVGHDWAASLSLYPLSRIAKKWRLRWRKAGCANYQREDTSIQLTLFTGIALNHWENWAEVFL